MNRLVALAAGVLLLGLVTTVDARPSGCANGMCHQNAAAAKSEGTPVSTGATCESGNCPNASASDSSNSQTAATTVASSSRSRRMFRGRR